MKTRPLVATTLLLVFAVAPIALAQSQKAKKPKKGSDPAASASASDSASASASAPSASAAPDTAPSATPSASASVIAVPEPPPEAAWDSTNTYEDPKEAYYFIGLRYRGTIIPKFLENLFVDDGATVYSNTFGVEFDMRKEGHSTIPWITYTDYSLGNTLFLQKDKADSAPNYSMVNSSLKGIFLGLDELWSVPLEPNHKVEYEFGFGVGLGFIFGNLMNNWVYQVPAGTNPQPPNTLKAADGNYYAQCQNQGQGTGCSVNDHSNAQTAKVGGYVEPDWFKGGAVPDLYARLSLQVLGIRYKPIKQLEMRFGAGFALTEGFWFQFSGDYGLEHKKDEGATKPAAVGPSLGSY